MMSSPSSPGPPQGWQAGTLSGPHPLVGTGNIGGPQVLRSAALPEQMSNGLREVESGPWADRVFGHASGVHNRPDWEDLMSHYPG